MRPVEREASTFFVIMNCVVGKSHYELAGQKNTRPSFQKNSRPENGWLKEKRKTVNYRLY
jgi:hypothetical protein